MAVTPTCPGLCCRSFPLFPSLEETLERSTALFGRGNEVEGAEAVIDMVAPDLDRPGHYRCRHFDEATGLCRNYANRPPLCSDYPNYGGDKPCEYCSYDLRQPDVPGVPWRPVEETGVFPPFEEIRL